MSRNQSLKWAWTIDRQNRRHFAAELWNGRRFEPAFNETVSGE
jgi:hypothetical protein